MPQLVLKSTGKGAVLQVIRGGQGREADGAAVWISARLTVTVFVQECCGTPRALSTHVSICVLKTYPE